MSTENEKLVRKEGNNKQEKFEYLTTQIKYQIDAFDTRRRRNRNISFQLSMTITGLSLIVTVLAGIGTSTLLDKYNLNINIIILLVSASVSFLSSWNSFFNYRDLWIRYKKTSNELKGLHTEIEYYSKSKKLSEDEIDKYFLRFIRILKETNSDWMRLLENRPKPKEELELSSNDNEKVIGNDIKKT